MTGPGPFVRDLALGRRRLTFARASLYAFLVLAVVSWVYILVGANSGLADLFTSRTWDNAGDFLRQLLGIGEPGRPAFLQLGRWAETGKLAYKTLLMSVLAIGLAGSGVLLTFLPAARNVSNGDLGGRPSAGLGVVYHVLRLVFAVTRAVPELVWAMVIVFFLSPGVLPGAIALGLHNYGIVGKLSAEVVENMDPGPARALRSSGAGNVQMLAYGIIPQVMPQFLTYLFYRWEVVIRTTVVVGFVSAGGLGREFRLSLSYFQYTDVALIIAWYLVLVVAVDLLSAWLRRLVRSG
ncbi:MAG: ABC transporter permease subunit [Chloroflexi bacterium]|nr:ABC transporter permease subunit [Chloroflexota bacterium]MDA1270842.1 ABC transporter permease subunit [Chloroflexota bacterium]